MVRLIRTILDLLEPRERRNFFLLMGLIMVQGLFDMAGVAAILPFLAVVSDPSLIETSRFYAMAYAAAGSPEINVFLTLAALAVIAVIVVGFAVKVVTLWAIARFSHMRRYHLASRLLAHILRQPYDWFLRRHGAQLSKTVLSEVDRMIGSNMIPALRILSQVVSLVLVGALLIVVDPVMALTALGAIGSVYGLIFFVVRRTLGTQGRIQVEENTKRYRIAQEALGGIKDVKIDGLEETFADRFRTPSYKMAKSYIVVQVITEMPRFLLEAVIFGGIVLVVLLRLTGPEASLQDLVPVLGLFAAAGLRMFPAIQQIYHSMSQMRSGEAVVMEVASLLNEVRGSGSGQRVPPPAMGLDRGIELRGVRYSYPGAAREVLSGIDMAIPALTSVGLVGGTGAGKTTAVDLILGLLDPTEGALLVDGVEIGDANRRAWQRSIGYVPQSIFLADDTVAANIAFGVPAAEIDRAAVEKAAKLAELHDFVLGELEDGYDTFVGERGVRLSGGQRQRIGIARALYQDPALLVLDEATSALDNLTEHAVMQAVQNIGGQKTVVMIAHRLSTVRNCDTIFVMERGRIVDQGRYDELMETSDAFRRIAAVS
ncbi:MAG: ABC transporter ATP-binding protein [Paracoccaceae bacterium]|nr:ABC transporter ATP-binding protein [Paracoccaceae bacterium]